MKKTLYHGTTMNNALSILKEGFDFNKCGCNWGCTYGKGIYFSPSYDEAHFYAGEDGIVLSFELELECYYLDKDISPSKKKSLKCHMDIIVWLIQLEVNMLCSHLYLVM